MTTPVFPQVSLADAEREIDSHIFSRSPEQDHEAKLRRVAEALSLLGDPHHDLRLIHITGTNGKTSTSRMIESLLRHLGLRTGLFTSPHLTTLRERIMIDGEPLSQEALVRLWQSVAPAIHSVDAASIQRGGPRMSFFEVLTVLGLVAYADAGVDVAVIEVGIGGLRDATNVVTGEVAVLTPMASDHERYLTGGLPGIAHEKSGIIKPGATVVSAVQQDAAARVISAAVAERGATIFWEGAHLSVESRRAVRGGQVATLRTAARTYVDVFIPLHGEFQAQNALTALAACETFLGDGIPRSLELAGVARGFANASSPGRMEVVSDEPTIILDAAHNPHGIEALAAALSDSFDAERYIGVVAVLADKDGDGILAGLAGIVDEVVITRTASARAMPAEELAELARAVFGEDRVSVADTVGTAIDAALERARPDRDAVLVAGSITLVGEARRYVREGRVMRAAGDGEQATPIPA